MEQHSKVPWRVETECGQARLPAQQFFRCGVDPVQILAMPKRVLDVAAIIRRLDFGNLPQRGGRNSCPLAPAARL